MDTITKVISYIADYINSVPASSWYTLGALLGSSSIVIAVVAWIKRDHLKQVRRRDEPGHRHGQCHFLVNADLLPLSFILTNGPTSRPFLPFFGTHLPQISLSVPLSITSRSRAWHGGKQERR
jgi:hypothetical protein